MDPLPLLVLFVNQAFLHGARVYALYNDSCSDYVGEIRSISLQIDASMRFHGARGELLDFARLTLHHGAWISYRFHRSRLRLAAGYVSRRDDRRNRLCNADPRAFRTRKV